MEFDRIAKEAVTLYDTKETNYGGSFHQTFLEEGFATSRIRLNDKLERFKRMTKSGQYTATDESIRDTLMDLACYSIMTIMEIDEIMARKKDTSQKLSQTLSSLDYGVKSKMEAATADQESIKKNLGIEGEVTDVNSPTLPFNQFKNEKGE